MVTTEELKQMLRDEDYTLLTTALEGADSEERWEDPAGHVVYFEEACKIGLNRCTCCGEIKNGPSAACVARHEGKDCNCYIRQTKTPNRDNTVGQETS